MCFLVKAAGLEPWMKPGHRKGFFAVLMNHVLLDLRLWQCTWELYGIIGFAERAIQSAMLKASSCTSSWLGLGPLFFRCEINLKWLAKSHIYTETASLFCLNRFLLGSCILNWILLLRAAGQEEVFAHLQSCTESACQSQVIPAGSFSRASHTPRPSDLQMGNHDVFDGLIFCRFPFAGQHKDTCRWGPLPHLCLSAMPVLPLLPIWGFHQASKSKERTWKRWIGGTTFMIYPNFKSN